MLVWGSTGKTAIVGDAAPKHCNVCGENRSFTYAVSYKLRHIWYLIRWSTGKSYFQYCNICQNGMPVEKAQIDAQNLTGEGAKNPIPLFDRLGWAIGLGILAVLMAGVLAAGNADTAQDSKSIAAPRIGDLYSVDIDKFTPAGVTDGGSFGGDYGVFRVAGVNGAQVTLDIPKIVYSRMKGVQRDISNGETKNSSYYNGQMQVAIPELKKLHDGGAINNVDRE